MSKDIFKVIGIFALSIALTLTLGACELDDLINDDDVDDIVNDDPVEEIIEVEEGESLQEAVDVAEPGDKIKVKPGEYNEHVNIETNDIALTAEEEHETEAIHLAVREAEGVTVEGFIISGSEVDGVYIEDSKNIDVRNNIIEGHENDGVNITSESSDVLIEENIIENNGLNTGREGIAVRESSDAIVKNNDIIESGGGGLFVLEESDAKIDYNDIKSNAGPGILIRESSSTSIEENTIKDNYFDSETRINGILIEDSDIGSIDKNKLTDNWAGIAVLSSSVDTINDNTSKRHTGDGIFVYDDSDVAEINGNILEGNYHGISVRDGSEVEEIENNYIEENSQNGISIEVSEVDINNENIIKNNGNRGLSIHGDSVAAVENNTIAEHTDGAGQGIGFDDSEVDIRDNEFRDNEIGLGYSNPIENYSYDISGNDFENNDLQVVYYTNEDKNWIPSLLEEIYGDNNFIPEKNEKVEDIEEVQYEDDLWGWEIATDDKEPEEEKLVIKEEITATELAGFDNLEGKLLVKNYNEAETLKSIEENVVFDGATGERSIELDTAKEQMRKEEEDLVIEFDEDLLWDLRSEEEKGEGFTLKILDEDEEFIDDITIILAD